MRHDRSLHGVTLTLTFSTQDLIADCWSGDAAARPAARDVVARLTAMEAEIEQMDRKCPRAVVKGAPAGGQADSAASGGDAGGSCCAVS